jgi:DNA-binding CsgD family transcriptional regulator
MAHSPATLAERTIVGRAAECAVLDELAADVRDGCSGAAVFVGPPGSGKTALLQYAADSAVGITALRLAGAEAERALAFAALHRLLAPYLRRAHRLSGPHREALELTFGLGAGPPPDRIRLGLGVLALLSDVAAENSLLCLIDDAQWLDPESLAVLAFVARRLDGEPIGMAFGATARAGDLAALAGLPTHQLGPLEAAPGASILEIFALMGLTVLELGLGRYPEALGWGLQVFHDDPPGFGSRILPDIVEAGVRGGDRAAAEAAMARLTERAGVSFTPWALGLLARSRALLAADSDAEPYYQEAIRQLAGTAMRTELARAHLLYGEWLRRRKRRRDAQLQLQTAYDMFTALGAAAFAERAGVERRAAGRKLPSANAFGLTPQENEVARHAAAGATNAEIASRLFITASTVEYHLSKVFRKLGVTSRRQLAAALADGIKERSAR